MTLNSGLTEYVDANGVVQDLPIKEEFYKRLENERKDLRLEYKIDLGKNSKFSFFIILKASSSSFTS